MSQPWTDEEREGLLKVNPPPAHPEFSEVIIPAQLQPQPQPVLSDAGPTNLRDCQREGEFVPAPTFHCYHKHQQQEFSVGLQTTVDSSYVCCYCQRGVRVKVEKQLVPAEGHGSFAPPERWVVTNREER